MATLYTQQANNTRKTWLLMAVFLVIVIALGWLISFYYDNQAILYFAIIFSLVMNFASYWWSDKIVLSMSGAKPADHNSNMELYHLVENLSITAGLPMPKIYLINDPAPNAFATGRDKKHAVVAVTTGLLGMLNKNELEGVIAHELSHIGNRDILLQSAVVVLVGLIAILSDMFIRSRFLFGSRDDDNKASGILAIVGVIFIVLSPIIATLIQLAISRQREFLADSSGALLTRYPEGLASALQKIGSYSAPMKKASNAMAHMYISNPFGARAVKGISKLFMTHPPVEERIQALRGMSF
ncbi:MAG: Protease HtpX-like protein [Parcubacteria group bacterium GW2011_GWC1_43_11b]|uniref:Protease HtpX homolog n=1 Tax=Candidatus Vogelbacteria bacterium RIFOXYB1_FULL_42_16 TaxID=1802436 RepID=A0A1G2QD26_9BACT|nr:MAG: Protease HtpX-like protein [Parcubacteria group bacterium GW2011_GWB1_42_9]KKS87796.1 MAG: Protease HtpX-like protein [Parcubacteria group bacterium GW2011_GWC1_43_11b]KKT10043.1 MAG: Protease HtpX-like protein [Parcubacteria group bacterium GW2011_GWA1_43_21]OHA58338.1 MAG: zinc metalloprotease HtpX [Candidatus Vogelbacteria bacterium RIFOXYB1_FULL_42_16]